MTPKPGSEGGSAGFVGPRGGMIHLMSSRAATKDPRHIVTPDAFEVAPDLLGRPLARPWRRAAALLADGLFVFLLTRLGSVSASLAAAVVFLVLVFRKPVERRGLRWTRRVLAVAGSFVVFATALLALEWSKPNPYTGMSAGQWMEFGMAAGSQDPEERAEAAREIVSGMLESGAAKQQIQPVIDSLDLPPELKLSLEDAIAFGRPASEADDELSSDDATRSLERRIERLQVNVRELYAENLELRDEVENPSFMRVASSLATDLGLTFGWSGLYFTLFVAWWGGRTPGKWLFGLRVVRLDHRPVSLLGAFERFAGYAAGLATGLLGFLQVFWDPNRQALQDKIVGTVVLVEPGRG